MAESIKNLITDIPFRVVEKNLKLDNGKSVKRKACTRVLKFLLPGELPDINDTINPKYGILALKRSPISGRSPLSLY
jgi:hypothetical protein